MCLYFDTTDGYLRFISIVGQTTVPFFPVVNFSSGSKNIAVQTIVPFLCSHFFWVVIGVRILIRTPIRYGTYDRKKLLPEKKVQSSGRLCFSVGSNYNRKKFQPEKKGSVVWPTVDINLR